MVTARCCVGAGEEGAGEEGGRTRQLNEGTEGGVVVAGVASEGGGGGHAVQDTWRG